MNNLMIDLETMGKKPNAPIVSIGAVFFDPQSGELGQEFYSAVNLDIDIGQLGCGNYDALMLAALDAFRASLPAPVVPDEMVNNIDNPYGDEDLIYEQGKIEGWNACRAAMLQAGNHTEQHLDMVDHSGDANEKVDCRLTFDQWLSQQNEPIDVDCGCVSTEAFYHWLRVAYEAGNSPVTADCWCRACRPVTMSDMRFVVCPECGNKRCPHANDHNNACTGSNEPGQVGSAYPAAPQQEVKSALEHGMQRYAGAMQKLSEGDK
ncbi:3'-5' exonuclease [Citrobacter freundii]|uniref:3'-5' exonuclease n=2 Tax=Citrobacter freundii TaxID=546 RepID=UPI0011AE1C2C|nr:3'-5' exonuclease [Citrobacter freundii]MEB0977257.1 3'-5' exonuclease [Citrobacter freundii]MEB2754308.1 3'-5' exonuclease [Citrobacter freundii]WOR51381.1 3'-5' exonuclease [Citrobacter freundii]HAU5802086.1 3'-5' exoribonuclease [Citrobacter freundii]